jgi:Malectin domain
MNLRNAAIAWMVVLATACAGTLDDRDQFLTGGAPSVADAGAADAARAASACPDVPAAVLAPSCATAGCHAATNPQSKLDLASPNLAARVVGVAALTGGFLVDPAHPDQSTLYRRLLPNAPGPRMPPGAPLDDATIACVLSWAQGLAGGGGPPVPPADGGPPGPAADGGSDADVRTATRVVPGASAPYTDHDGNVWSADVGSTGGTITGNTPQVAIDKTTDAPLYNTERYGTFTYAFTVPNGSYTVTLKFAETYTQITAAAQRQFNVTIDGQQVLTAFDIFAEAGGRNIAVDKSFPIDVTGGTVTIAFDPGAIQSPKVDAIAIVPK